jgi:hypothetical protein
MDIRSGVYSKQRTNTTINSTPRCIRLREHSVHMLCNIIREDLLRGLVYHARKETYTLVSQIQITINEDIPIIHMIEYIKYSSINPISRFWFCLFLASSRMA